MFNLIKTGILLIILSVRLQAQKTDSLMQVYQDPKTADSGKMAALSQLSFILSYQNPDKGLYYATKQLEIANRTNIKTYYWTALFNSALPYSIKGNYDTAIHIYQAIIHTPESEVSDQSWLKSRSIGNLGALYIETGNYPVALKYLHRSLAIALKQKDSAAICMKYQHIARCYTEMLYDDLAIKNAISALKIADRKRDTASLISIYITLANIYDHTDHKNLCLSYLEKALYYSSKTNDLYAHYFILVDIGNYYYALGKNQSALGYYLLSIQKLKVYDPEIVPLVAMKNAGTIYYDQKKLTLAQSYFEKVYNYAIQNDDTDALAEVLIDMAYIDRDKGHYTTALDKVSKALSINQQNKSLDLELKCYEFLYTHYKQINHPKLALHYHEYYESLKDSSDNETKRKNIARIEVEYEYSKKQLADSINHAQEKLRKDTQIQLQKSELKQGRLQKILLWSGIGILIVFGGFMYNRYRLTNTQKQLAEQQHEKLQLQKKQETEELQQQVLRLQMNPHFIFNATIAIQQLIKNDRKNESIDYLNKFTRLTRQILEYSRQEYISLQDELECLENYFSLQKLLYRQDFDYTITVSVNDDTDEVLIPPMLTQPFIENALQHGISKKQEKGVISVSFYQDNEWLCIEITDNGLGIRDKNQQDQRNTSMATSITRERLALLNIDNTIHLENRVNDKGDMMGARLFFKIPYTRE